MLALALAACATEAELSPYVEETILDQWWYSDDVIGLDAAYEPACAYLDSDGSFNAKSPAGDISGWAWKSVGNLSFAIHMPPLGLVVGVIRLEDTVVIDKWIVHYDGFKAYDGTYAYIVPGCPLLE